MQETANRKGSHWAWFIGLLAALGVAGAVLAFMAMIAFSMATDPCHGDASPFRVCHMSIRGENFLVLVPWVALGGAMVAALAAAALAARKRLSPLLGLVFWFIGGAAAGAIAYEAAFHI